MSHYLPIFITDIILTFLLCLLKGSPFSPGLQGVLEYASTFSLQWGLPRGSAVKKPPAMQEMQETWVLSLDQEDPLEESMATHFSILAWRIPRMEEPGRLQSTGSQSWTQMKWPSTHTLPSPGRLKFHFYSREPQSSVSFLEKRQALICPRHNLLPCWLQNQVENPSPSS